jgi:acyl-coenzyme A thioesterase PaaI-like protein
MAVTADDINRMMQVEHSTSSHRCLEVSETHALARVRVADTDLRPGSLISGPTQFRLADAALWYLVFGAIGRIEPMAVTSELSIRFLRPAQGTMLFARATLDACGRRNVVGTVRLWVDDGEHRPVSVAQGTYVRPQPARN